MFRDRADAGQQLAARLSGLAGKDVVVLGLPRGGVAVAFEVARRLGAPLDVIVVRKLGVPFQPELGMGAIGEGGVRILNEEVVALAGVGPQEVEAVERRERAELDRRARQLRGQRPPVEIAGKVAVVVDDGIATGFTARAACQVARARGARRVVLAVPVGPEASVAELSRVADEVVCLATPPSFFAVGQWYQDFSQLSDAEVVALLETAAKGPSAGGRRPPGGEEPVELEAGGRRLAGQLWSPPEAQAVVVFAHGSGSGRHSPHNRTVASVLARAGLASLLVDLLTEQEQLERARVFDVALLAGRLAEATAWARRRPGWADLPIGYFGASTGAAAALWAAAEPGSGVGAVVSRGGRPDLAWERLGSVRCPTLLIVGSLDPEVLELNRRALERLGGEGRLEVVPGASHLFEEPGALEVVAEAARQWFSRHLLGQGEPPGGPARPGTEDGAGWAGGGGQPR